MSVQTVRAIGSPPTRAIILLTFGAGNIPNNREDIQQVLQEFNESGIILVNITQCVAGSVEGAYTLGGGKELDRLGIISGNDMTIECATTKLSYLLGKYPKDTAKVKEEFARNLHGEISVSEQRKFVLTKGWRVQEAKKVEYEESEFIQGIANSLELRTGYEIDKIAEALHPSIATAAAANQAIDVLARMKSQRENLSAYDHTGNTPMHIAVLYGHLDIIKFLLNSDVDINA